MDLRQAEKLAKDLMLKHGLDPMKWEFKWDTSLRRFGVCRHRTYTKSVIGLSKHLVSLNPESDVLDTILHEIAHALTKGHGHDAVWKRKCVEIGAKPNRCFSSDEVTMPKMRYQAICGGCGKTFQKSRMVVRQAKKESCRCQSHKSWTDSSKILLTWIDTKR